MVFDFDELMLRLEQLVGRRLRIVYVGVIAAEKVPITPASRSPGVRIRWSGRLVRIRSTPNSWDCARFQLRPRHVTLFFDKGIRCTLEVEHLVGFRRLGRGLHVMLARGMTLFLLPVKSVD